jgi:hypothetical protein
MREWYRRKGLFHNEDNETPFLVTEFVPTFRSNRMTDEKVRNRTPLPIRSTELSLGLAIFQQFDLGRPMHSREGRLDCRSS